MPVNQLIHETMLEKKTRPPKKKKGQQEPSYRWNEVIIKKELVLIPSTKCEVPEYVRKYLPEIEMMDWYWAIRTKKYKKRKDKVFVVICFRHKKDAEVFKKMI